jgi:hypothetical protein
MYLGREGEDGSLGGGRSPAAARGRGGGDLGAKRKATWRGAAQPHAKLLTWRFTPRAATTVAASVRSSVFCDR